MQNWQQYLVFFMGALGLFGLSKGYFESKYKKNAFGLTRWLNIIGSFVWADAVVFGLFWLIFAGVSLVLNDWWLFLFGTAVFWAVRGLGETQYWIAQQFSSKNRNPVETLLFHEIFHDDSIWFVYQIFWQCVAVIAVIASMYFGAHWIGLSLLLENK